MALGCDSSFGADSYNLLHNHPCPESPSWLPCSREQGSPFHISAFPTSLSILVQATSDTSAAAMDEGLTLTNSYSEDDFYCPICQEVLRKSVRTMICRHVFCSNNWNKTSTSDNVETYQENTSSSGHPTFKCPLCKESNFTRQHLLDHCNSNHLLEIVPVTCPICMSLPWGDPNQITINFVNHLNQRHQFDYRKFVNLQLDEETQYQIAIEESFHTDI
ncbi:E3 ubiquitin-protein ligase RNF138-like [Saccopteryx leptura]|uniref:E3 ubiquitin-protein ligase RNF138-like n=1 Tax=Saccopteryx leptura TaxID=249018 RepID=UPI00339BEDDD